MHALVAPPVMHDTLPVRCYQVAGRGPSEWVALPAALRNLFLSSCSLLAFGSSRFDRCRVVGSEGWATCILPDGLFCVAAEWAGLVCLAEL